jgi:hypothetical protein
MDADIDASLNDGALLTASEPRLVAFEVHDRR